MKSGADDGFPQSDSADQLNRSGLAALQSAFPADLFIFRAEHESDKGVDATVELVSNGRALNLRGSIQLKSTGKASLNRDGSASFAIPTQNLRYLLNATCPMYVLFIASTRELRFAWAWDEVNRILSESTNWEDQGTVTIRFSAKIADSLSEIATRIKREASASLEFLNAARAGTSACVQVAVDTQTWSVTASADALRIIESQGTEMVNSGRVEELLRLASVLPYVESRRPKVGLVLAYAFSTMGSLLEAQGNLSVAKLGRGVLNDLDQRFLAFLDNSLRFQTGQIDSTKYVQFLTELSVKDQSGFGLALRLEAALRKTLWGDRGGRADLRAAIHAVHHMASAADFLQFQAKYCELLLQGLSYAEMFADKFAVLRGRAAVGIPYDPILETEPLAAVAAQFEVAGGSLKAEACSKGNPAYEANVISLMLLVRTIVLANMSMGVMPRRDQTYELILGEAERAINIYSRVGDLEGESRVRLQRANIRALYGDTSPAQEEAAAVLPIAEALGLFSLEATAREIIAGKDYASVIREAAVAAASADTDISMADTPDSEMEDWARNNQAVLKLPDECFEYILGEVFALREGARTTTFWCRHFDLHQNKLYALSPLIMYSSRLKWSGHCAKFDLAGREDMTDVCEAIEHFKAKHCETCLSRSPKVEKDHAPP